MEPQTALSANREDSAEPIDKRREKLEGAIDFGVGGVAGEAEADGAVGAAAFDSHRQQDGGGLKTAAAARGTGAGADPLLTEEEQDRFGFELGEGDVGGVGTT